MQGAVGTIPLCGVGRRRASSEHPHPIGGGQASHSVSVAVRGTHPSHVARTQRDRLSAGHAEGDTSAHLSAALGNSTAPVTACTCATGAGGASTAGSPQASTMTSCESLGAAVRPADSFRIPYTCARTCACGRRQGRGLGGLGAGKGDAVSAVPLCPHDACGRSGVQGGRGRVDKPPVERGEARGRLDSARRVGSDLIPRDQHQRTPRDVPP